MGLTRSSFALLVLFACGDPSFDALPDSPAHRVDEDGALHAERYEDPFLCGDPTRPMEPERGVPCPPSRPNSDSLLSCDAAGCHGNFDFRPTSPRLLYGAEGPSCYTCHGEEWDDDDEEDDD